MDTQTELLELQEKLDIKQIMANVEAHTNTPEDDGIKFIKGKVETPAEIAANCLFDNMNMTLHDITQDAKKKIEAGHRRSREYLKVARGIEALSIVTAGLANDSIPLKENFRLEADLHADGDEVKSYYANNFTLDGTAFNYAMVLIRPHHWEQSVKTKMLAKKYDLQIVESADPRMEILAIPKHHNNGEIIMRLDQEDLDQSLELTFDIIIGGNESKLIDDLEFPDALQRSGHHFSSRCTAENMHTTFADILYAYDHKLAKHIEGSQPLANSTPLHSADQGS